MERVNGGPWTAVSLGSPGATGVTVTLAYGAVYQFQVGAVDNAGNVGPVATSPTYRPTIYRPVASANVALAGAWSWATCGSCIGGRVRWAGVRNARATLTVPAWAIGWVAVGGPTRGKARLYVDRVLRGTYSTSSKKMVARWLITSTRWRTLGTHSFRVEVAGTAGHPRIDLDVFVAIR